MAADYFLSEPIEDGNRELTSLIPIGDLLKHLPCSPHFVRLSRPQRQSHQRSHRPSKQTRPRMYPFSEAID